MGPDKKSPVEAVEPGKDEALSWGIDVATGVLEASGGTNGIGIGLNEGAVVAKEKVTGGSTVAADGGMVMISGASGSFVLEA